MNTYRYLVWPWNGMSSQDVMVHASTQPAADKAIGEAYGGVNIFGRPAFTIGQCRHCESDTAGKYEQGIFVA